MKKISKILVFAFLYLVGAYTYYEAKYADVPVVAREFCTREPARCMELVRDDRIILSVFWPLGLTADLAKGMGRPLGKAISLWPDFSR